MCINIGRLVYATIPIILGILILAYTDWKIVGIASIVFGISAMMYHINTPCSGCYGVTEDTKPEDYSPEYKKALSARTRVAIFTFIIGLGIALLIWNFVGRKSFPKIDSESSDEK